MGVSTYYLGVPRTTLEAFRNEAGCFEVLQALWHEGGGAWTAVDEFEQSELLEMIDGQLPSGLDPKAVLKAYARLIEKANASHPALADQSAYVEKTHAFHLAMLGHFFRDRGRKDADTLASAAVDGGGKSGKKLGELWCTSEAVVQQIGNALEQATPAELLRTLPALAAGLAGKLYWMSDGERDKYLKKLTKDEDLQGEVESLLALYTEAAETNHVVLLG